MIRNFRIVDAVAIQVGSVFADLHNHFDLSSLDIDFAAKTVRILFTRTIDAQNYSSCRRLALDFADVDYLCVHLGKGGDVWSNVEEMGYKEPSDFNHDWLMNDAKAGVAEHFFLRLADDRFVRVHGSTALALPDPVLS